ncbi:heavy metal-associated isoprenylated plant protein 28-like [Asparagus officinalis]|uniref:heavy metal-associated isoprenylated plant protein 28-like n=1 Tax=Asparagus officinalis TaxID=4686 RepID=UPI00098E434A|nr:heavy metal-associated isoprenylated plant protein 28-like [Asparagus officinalis]
MSIIELCVHMCCSGCEMKIRKYLGRLDGIDSVDIDMAMQKVTVTGYVDQKKVLKAVRKTGRRAVLWPQPAPGSHMTGFNQQHYNYAAQPAHLAANTVTANPFAYSTASTSSYNYRKHGYDESIMHGYYQMPVGSSGIVGERAGTMFSDDNTSACSIM